MGDTPSLPPARKSPGATTVLSGWEGSAGVGLVNGTWNSSMSTAATTSRPIPPASRCACPRERTVGVARIADARRPPAGPAAATSIGGLLLAADSRALELWSGALLTPAASPGLALRAIRPQRGNCGDAGLPRSPTWWFLCTRNQESGRCKQAASNLRICRRLQFSPLATERGGVRPERRLAKRLQNRLLALSLGAQGRPTCSRPV